LIQVYLVYRYSGYFLYTAAFEKGGRNIIGNTGSPE